MLGVILSYSDSHILVGFQLLLCVFSRCRRNLRRGGHTCQWPIPRRGGTVWWGELPVPPRLLSAWAMASAHALAHEDARGHLYFQGNGCEDGELLSPKDDVIALLPFPHSLTRGLQPEHNSTSHLPAQAFYSFLLALCLRHVY